MVKNNGITLIALIVTIIVLLILAGVSIMLLTGDNGILNKASSGKEEYNYQSAVENLKIKLQDCNLNVISQNGTSATLKDVYNILSNQTDVTIVAVKNQTASVLQGVQWTDTINEIIVLQDQYPNILLGVDQKLNIIDERNYYASSSSVNITYDANGGNGSIQSTVAVKNGTSAQVTITNSYFTRTGYTLLGFSEDKNATSATYIRGNTYTFTKGATLYAIWGTLQYANYSATGSYQTYSAISNRVYQIECWGASGGTSATNGYWCVGSNTYGAYTSGYINPNQNMSFFVYVGQVGKANLYTGTSASEKYLTPGGWNGGGDNYSSRIWIKWWRCN